VFVSDAHPDNNQSHAVRSGQNPRIVLTWLALLRWLAVAGQVLATAAAAGVLDLRLPLAPIGAVIGVTLVSNVALVLWLRWREPHAALVPLVLLLDTGLLSVLLYFAGGAANPFSLLYLVHVAMAVVALEIVWTWIVLAAAAGCYLALFWWHVPLFSDESPPPTVQAAGQAMAFILVGVLIAYFTGRVTLALRKRERELAALREQAARSEQLAALTTLAAGAAHELGTPLGTIALIARELELAARNAGTSCELVEDAQIIRQEVERCRGILSRMRVDILEEPSDRSMPMSEDDLIEYLRLDLSDSEMARLRVECDRPLELRPLPGRAIQQALGVLVRNAFEASPPERAVSLSIERRDAKIVFRVEDAGAGMPPEVLRRAGEPFFTTKPGGRGLGLGLFLVRLVAERYGGAFRLSSREGEGTQSILELPEAEVARLPAEDRT